MQYLAKNHILPPQGVDFNFGGDWSTLHFHDYWEFILITDSCTHIINNQKIPLNKGNALIVRPQDKHKFVDSKNTISQFNIKITNEDLPSLTDSYDKKLFPFLQGSHAPITLKLSSYEYNIIYKNVQSALFDKSTEKLSLYLHSAIHTILNHFVTTKYIPLHTTQQYSTIVQLMMEKISMWSNFSQPLANLLKDFHFSYMQLYRIFKKETGYSPSDYFLYSKMIYASTLLLTSPDSIVSIAQAIGYATQSHFGKAFKTYFGYTPTEYRNNGIPSPPLQNKFTLTPSIPQDT